MTGEEEQPEEQSVDDVIEPEDLEQAYLPFNQRFRVTRKLGQGAAGVVYLCYDYLLGDRPVAVKVFLPKILRTQGGRRRVAREVRVFRRLQHENVVSLYDFIAEDDVVALVMEYVEGGCLKRLLRDRERLDVDEALHLAIQCCRGLDAIHQLGIVHRDLKPENVLLTKEGIPRIADFSVATDDDPLISQELFKADEANRSGSNFKSRSLSVTTTGGIIGTLRYLAPECLRFGSAVHTPVSDCYSLAMITFELLTGQLPYPNLEPPAFLRFKVEQPALTFEQCHFNVPDVVEEFFALALAREPSARFASAADLRRGFEDLRDELSRGPKRLRFRSTTQRWSIFGGKRDDSWEDRQHADNVTSLPQFARQNEEYYETPSLLRRLLGKLLPFLYLMLLIGAALYVLSDYITLPI